MRRQETKPSQDEKAADKPDWQLFAERHYRWNYFFGIFTSTVIIGSIRTQMLPLYLDELVNLSSYQFLRDHRNGLISFILTMANFLQFVSPMLISNVLETRERKKPAFWILAAIGAGALSGALFLTYFLSDVVPTAIFVLFSLMWTLLFCCMGCMIVTGGDVFGKAIPSASRSLFAGIRFEVAAIVAALCGLAIAYFLKERSPNPFRGNYAPIFLLALVAAVISWIAFGLVREPVHAVRTERKKTWGHFKDAARLILMEDKNARAFCIMRALQTVAELAKPLMVLYMTRELMLPRAVSGLAITVTSVVNAFAYFGFGLLGNRFGTKFLLQCTNVFGVLSSIAFVTIPIAAKLIAPHLPLHDPLAVTKYLYIFAVVLYYIAYSGQNISKFNYPLDIAPAKLRPTYVGFTTTFIVPFILLQNFGGAIADATSYRTVFAIEGIFFALAIIPGFWMKTISKRADAKEQ